jgi:DNA-binding winged helix-turn-helix (wHTH) protein
MLKLVDLANRPDFEAGPLRISPGRRLVEGPAGALNLEPIVMKVLLLLLDADGAVVTRDDLFANAWGGVFVGDDSLNRAIVRVRKVAAEVAPGSFEIETIPRTGYRLVGNLGPATEAASERLARASRVGRRTVIVGALAAAGTGGLGLWEVRSREDRQFNDLVDRGQQALSYGDPSAGPVAFFARAVAMRPDDARAQGLLAYSETHYGDPPTRDTVDHRVVGRAGALVLADRAARAALAIDPNEPNARLALTELQASTLDFAATEDRLRAILATAPENVLTMRSLWGLLQCAGRSRDAFALVERAIGIEPLAAANNFPRAQMLWILGRTAEADRVIDNAMQYWPSHRNVRFARFIILAFTGRPQAALAMLNDAKTRPQDYSPEAISLWRVSLRALDEPTGAQVSAAHRANLQAAKQNPDLSNIAVMVLSALGEVDAAFEIANSLLLYRSLVAAGPKARAPVKSTAWRFAPWLFTPPLAPLRADPRFNLLCDGIGLTEYWAKRGIKPDYQLGIT